ncbi:MAG: tRNA lysidine(34) synthetase TilS [Thiobacillaceae bacterium]|nr:tRNA lysidine(34) synthetase TilS [Thiobacillaceae bacterium]MDW8324060.1 tRNA lysidine(34) synthetase TilS [Burkholderiales bacterium]
MVGSRKPAPAEPGFVLATLRAELAAHVPAGARIAVGLSGGVDSVVLLHALKRLEAQHGHRLSAVHVHHGLSPRADDWAAFCVRYCQRLGVPIELARVQVTPAGRGLEAAARVARYQVFAALSVDFVALAHQLDDQAETVLHHLLRGSGPDGLAGMPVERALPGGRVRLLRPLLSLPRAAIEAYAVREGLSWVEDDSNLDPSLTRNYLRRQVLPLVEARFPAWRETVARSARLCAEAAGLLQQLARLDAEAATTQGGLGLEALRRLDRPRARNLLRFYLRDQGAAQWSQARLEAVLDQLLGAGADNRIDIALAQGRLRVWRGRVWCVPPAPSTPAEPVPWRGEHLLAFGAGCLRFEPAVGAGVSRARLMQAPVSVRLRRGGERLQPDCARPRRSLKHLWQEGGIPPWERARLPLVYAGEALVWAAGVGVDCAYQARADEPGLLIAWVPACR